MTIENGIQALMNLEKSYTKRIKEYINDSVIDKKNVDRLAQIRTGVKQSIRLLDKIKDKNADVLPLGL